MKKTKSKDKRENELLYKPWLNWFRKRKKVQEAAVKFESIKKAKKSAILDDKIATIEIKVSDLESFIIFSTPMFRRLTRVLTLFKSSEGSFQDSNWIQYSDKLDSETLRRNKPEVKKEDTLDECLIQFAKLSSPVGDYVHRFFYEDLYFEVIDIATVTIACLPLSSSIDAFEGCMERLRKSTDEFIRRLKQVVYVECTNLFSSDELIFGRLLPFLWSEFNDNMWSGTFTVGSNVGLEIKKQISSLAYKRLHLHLMKISHLYTLISLDHITILQKEVDIHKSIILFRDKLEILLRMGYTYFLAMIEKDEMYFHLSSHTFDAFKSLEVILNSSPIVTHFDAILGIANALKIIYDRLARIIKFEYKSGSLYDRGLRQNSKKKRLVKELLFKEVDSLLKTKVTLEDDIKQIQNYIIFSTLININNMFLESGIRLANFFLFNRQSDSENLNYWPATVILDNDLYEDDTNHLKNFQQILFPLQVLNLGQKWPHYFEQVEYEEFEETQMHQNYHPLWRADLIRLIVNEGFTPKQTEVEIALRSTTKKKYFWEDFEQIKNLVLQQFGIATILRDNVVRHREWRNHFLIESLQRKRFLEVHLESYFQQHQPPSISPLYINSIPNLASRMFWQQLTGLSDELLRIVFPVRWFDPLLISLSFHVLSLHELEWDKYFKTSLMYHLKDETFFNVRPKDVNLGILLQNPTVKIKKIYQ